MNIQKIFILKTFLLMSSMGLDGVLVSQVEASPWFNQRSPSRVTNQGGGPSLPSRRATPSTQIEVSSECDPTPTHMMTKGLLQAIFLVGGDEISFEYNSQSREVQITIPPYFKNCGVQFIPRAVAQNNNVYVGITLSRPISDYLACLDNDERRGPESVQESGGSLTIPLDRVPGINFDQDINIGFLSPRFDRSGLGQGHLVGGQSNCHRYEALTGEKLVNLYLTPESSLAKDALDACESQNIGQIARLLQNLDQSTAGNTQDLRRELRRVLTSLLEKEAREDLNRLRDLATNFVMEDGAPKLSREMAREYAEEYLETLNRVNDTMFNPYITFIDELREERRTATSQDRERIDREIRDYNQKIQRFAKDQRRYGYDRVMDTLKHYGSDLGDYARDIEGYRLKSHYYGRYYEGRVDSKRGAPMRNAQTIERQVVADLGDFDKAFERFAILDDTRSGNPRHLQRLGQRMRQAQERRDQAWSNSITSIQKNFQKCVGMFHTPFKMQQCMQRAQREQQNAIRQRAAYNGMLRRFGNQQTELTGEWRRGQRARENQARNEDPFFWYRQNWDSGFGLNNPNDAFSLFGSPQGFSQFDMSTPFTPMLMPGFQGQQMNMMPQQQQVPGVIGPGFPSPGGYRLPSGL